MQRLSPLLIASCALAPLATAQLPLHQTLDSPTNSTWFGNNALGLSDLDGDGVNDYAVATVGYGSSAADRIDIYSGATGAIHLTIFEQDNQSDFGMALESAGDLNGDGLEDLLVGAPKSNEVASGNGSAFVFSGADGSVLWSKQGPAFLHGLGEAAATIDDLNGDGVQDFIIASTGESIGTNRGGIVRVYSGADQSELFWVGNGGTTGDTSEGFGDAVAAAGDLNGDGVPDFLVGVPFRYLSPIGRVGAVEGRSGVDGSLLFEVMDVNGQNSNAYFGGTLAAGVDLNGDGVGEILIGSTGHNLNGADGTLNVLDGATRTQIIQHIGTEQGPGAFGHHVGFLGDLNGDGFEDYGAAFAYTGTVGFSGYVRVYSGADHTLLDEISAPNGASGFGSALCGLGDVTGDALPDMFIGARQQREGYVAAIAGARVFGEVPTELTQSLDFAWVPTDPADTARGQFEVTGAAMDAKGYFALSGGTAAGSYLGASMWVDPSLPGFSLTPIKFDSTGVYKSPETTLRQAQLDGVNLYCQILALDPTSPLFFVTSPALELRLTN